MTHNRTKLIGHIYSAEGWVRWVHYCTLREAAQITRAAVASAEQRGDAPSHSDHLRAAQEMFQSSASSGVWQGKIKVGQLYTLSPDQYATDRHREVAA